MSENNDLGVQTVLENMETIVASEGGTLQFLSLDDGSLSGSILKVLTKNALNVYQIMLW